MKRKYFVIPLLVSTSLLSCSKKTEIETNNKSNNENNISLDKKKATLKVMDNQHKMLGFSYDVTKEYLDKDSYSRVVIDLKRLTSENPYSIISVDESGTYDSFYYGHNSSDYVNNITEKNEVSFNILPGNKPKEGSNNFTGNISNNKELITKHSYSTKYTFASVDVLRYVKSLRTEETPAFLSNYVTSKFITDLENLSPNEFVAAYGTHVLTNITLGGTLRILYKSTSTDQLNSATKTNTVKAGINAILPKIGLGLSVDKTYIKNESLETKNTNIEMFIRSKAGDGVDVKYNENNRDPYPQINKLSWVNSVNINNAGLVDINWKKTFPIYDFIPASHSYKKQQIIDAVKRYIEANTLKPLELIPVYQWYNPGNFHYAYGTNETQVHGNSYINQGIAFWVPKEANDKTVPVYQWYNTGNYIYAYGMNTTQQHGGKFVNQGRAFYGYNHDNNDPSLVPIYQWYHTKKYIYAYGENVTQAHGSGYINHGPAFRAYSAK
ncbi:MULTISPECIES: MAC/perforin domain-containing protein [Sphingobacterium]|uniref:MAC/perforin domain-containing protein n=1 Tax=Sphingobacterium kitahiroshimense TaxID=470446 RepID=A0ABV0C099_9SPHI|nr:MAC/perforin domain-containing protein [Sphingobacterium sp. JUb56]MBB2951201.1 hypothetical protein [Sphingobacterium sp. JUb56]